jgi:hypothetical protein
MQKCKQIIFLRSTGKKVSLGRPRLRQEDNFKIYFKNIIGTIQAALVVFS